MCKGLEAQKSMVFWETRIMEWLEQMSLLYSRVRGLSMTSKVIQSIPLSGNQQL